MMGKLFGNVAASLTMATVYIIGAYGLARHYGVAHLIPAGIVGWFIVYQILAVLLYGSVFISVGAACTNLSETQSFMTPIMLAIMLPMFVWFNVLQNPMSSFSVWLSLIPPSTPILMVLRLSATTTVPLWQPLLGIIGVLVTMSLCVFAAGRIFRIGILSQGNAPKFTELMRWVATG
jgi:ABC-type Na+ efflux pump permease subunit